MRKIALYSERVLWDSALSPATVVIENNIISTVQPGRVHPADCVLKEYGNSVIMPGLIDSHVHINEPGRTEWEGFNTATRSAARGGITTLVDMPLNSDPVSVNTAALRHKLDATGANLHVNCAFYGGLIPGNIDDLGELIQSGVFGIKAFLTHSGIEEFPNVSEADLRAAMPVLKKHDALLLVHCELDHPHPGQAALSKHPESYAAYLASRPRVWEDEAIALMIRLCEEFGVRTHIVHLSSSDSVGQLKAARARGLPITVETCPHYLVFDAEHIRDGATEFKCAPPIREKENQDILWQAVKDGLIDFVVTDHSPAPPGIKELESGDFSRAWGGIAGLQFSLPAFWTEARTRGLRVEDVSRLMSGRIAEFLGLDHAKGKIAPGFDADITVWNPEASFQVNSADILHRHKTTPYDGMTLYGQVISTYVAGYPVYDQETFNQLSKGIILLKQL